MRVSALHREQAVEVVNFFHSLRWSADELWAKQKSRRKESQCQTWQHCAHSLKLCRSKVHTLSEIPFFYDNWTQQKPVVANEYLSRQFALFVKFCRISIWYQNLTILDYYIIIKQLIWISMCNKPVTLAHNYDAINWFCQPLTLKCLTTALFILYRDFSVLVPFIHPYQYFRPMIKWNVATNWE